MTSIIHTPMPLSAGFLDRTAPIKPPEYIAFVKGRVLIHQEGLVWTDPDHRGHQVYLGTYKDKSIYAQDLSHIASPPGVPTDLWLLPRSISSQDMALACQGQHLLRWHAKNPLCAKCGHPTEPKNWGRHRHCPTCETDLYPRTDPAVIMLVQNPDRQRILLAHTHIMPEGLNSLLAGYVEPGEALEDTVRRETFEEAGLEVEDIRYVASQPWALSGSLMCGFTCVATTDTIQIDPEELESAAWYSRDDLARYRQNTRLIYPRRNTIARHLIDLWQES